MSEHRSSGEAAMDERNDDPFDPVLAEALGGDEPPDLTDRILSASAHDRARAFARVHERDGARRHRFVMAVAALLMIAVVVGVMAMRDEVGAQVATQDPSIEVEIADPAALAAFVPRMSSMILVARVDANGKRLSDMPEHAAVVADTKLRAGLQAALLQPEVVGASLPGESAQCEIRFCAGTSFVRARLHFDGESASLLFRTFSLPDVVEAEVASSLRMVWQELARKEAPPRRRVHVSSLRELVAAIGSDRTIELVGGPFELTAGDEAGEFPANEHVQFDREFGVECMVVRGVQNLHVRAVGSPVRLLSRSPADVIVVRSCRGLVLEGLVLGHVEGLAMSCVAPVLRCEESSDIVVRGCELFGCGTEAVVARTVERLRLESCEVHTCRHGVMTFENSRDLLFSGTVFRDCAMFAEGFRFDGCEGVTFADCSIRGMNGGVAGGPVSLDLFLVRMDEPVRIVGGEIVRNRCHALANSKLLLDLRDVRVRDNGPDADFEAK